MIFFDKYRYFYAQKSSSDGGGIVSTQRVGASGDVVTSPMMPVPGAGIGAGVASAVAAASMAPMVQVKIREMYFSILTQSQSQSCIEFKKFTRSSNELTFNSSSKFPSLSFMNERKERNF